MVSEPVPLSGPGNSLGLVEAHARRNISTLPPPPSSFPFLGIYFILFIIISATNTAIGPAKMGLRAPFCVAPAPRPFPRPSHSCAPIAWGEAVPLCFVHRGGMWTWYACRPCAQSGGWGQPPGFGAPHSSLAPMAHTRGGGGRRFRVHVSP